MMTKRRLWLTCLAAMLPALAGMPLFAEDLSPDALRQKAREVLRKGKYQTELPGQTPPPAPRRGGGGPKLPSVNPPDLSGALTVGRVLLHVVVWTLLALCAALILWGLYVALRKVSGKKGGGPGRRADDAEADPGVESPVLLRGKAAEQALAAAAIAADEQNYLEAVRKLFLQAAAHVARARRIALTRSETNGEYLTRLNVQPALRDLMGVLADVVDRCYYGGQPCARQDWETCRDAWRSVTEG